MADPIAPANRRMSQIRDILFCEILPALEK
jgi:hypothetical protein